MNRRQLLIVMYMLVLMVQGLPVHAHEMGTSALVLTEEATGTGHFVFKRTVGADGKVPPIDFQFQPACELRQVNTDWAEDNELVQRGSFHCSQALVQHAVQASGFTRLSPEMILWATPLSGEKIHSLLTPNNAQVSLGSNLNMPAFNSTPSEYVWIGVQHILFGLDHVLFITGLYLLWQQRGQSPKQLLGQFTLFTLGHSLTLALLVLGWLAVPTRAIEAWIALSVLWLAWELIRNNSNIRPLSTPWTHGLLIAAFGMLHGSGFALSMEERGFPPGALFSSLLMFNLGIEMGQIAIVSLLAALFRTLETKTLRMLRHWVYQSVVLTMGGAALYWTMDRIHAYV